MITYLTKRVSLREQARQSGTPWSTFQRANAQNRPLTGTRYTRLTQFYRNMVRSEGRAAGYPERLVPSLARLSPEQTEIRIWETDSIVDQLTISRTAQEHLKAVTEGREFIWESREADIRRGIVNGMRRMGLPWDEVRERYGKTG